MKDGAIICNTGHYDCEINIVDLEARAKSQARDPRTTTRSTCSRTAAASTCWRRAASSTWPPPRATRPRSWTCRSPTSSWRCCKLAKEGKAMKPGVYELPPEQDQELARIKLDHAWVCRIDALTRRADRLQRRLLRRDVSRQSGPSPAKRARGPDQIFLPLPLRERVGVRASLARGGPLAGEGRGEGKPLKLACGAAGASAPPRSSPRRACRRSPRLRRRCGPRRRVRASRRRRSRATRCGRAGCSACRPVGPQAYSLRRPFSGMGSLTTR